MPFVSIENHSILKDQTKISILFPITISDAALETTVEITLYRWRESQKSKYPRTQHGKQLRLKGKGMPVLRGGSFEIYISKLLLKFRLL